MGTFLALLGIRLGRAIVSWGLGSAGGGVAPVVVPKPGCMHFAIGDTAAMTISPESDTASMLLSDSDTATMTIEIEDC